MSTHTIKRKLQRAVKIALPIFVAIAIPVLLARCTPQWLPDSKGFVFSTGASVKLHDLESDKTKEIVRLKSPAFGVAVGPKGDRVAVVQFPPDAEPQGLQFAVYDMDGNEKHVSPVHPLKAGDGKPDYAKFLLSTYMSPDEKHLITFLPGEKAQAVVYDVERKTFRDIPNVMSFGFVAGMIAGGENATMPMTFDVSPITPDGKGFVALHQPDEMPEEFGFAYFTWDEEAPVVLEFPAEEKKIVETAAKDKEFGVATAPRWDGRALKMHLDGGTLNIHSGMRAVSFAKSMHADALLQHAEKQKVQVVAELAGGALVQVNKNEVQLFRPGAATVGLAKLADGGGFMAIVPSPDRRRVLLRTMTPEGGAAHYRVVDAKGETLADFE